MNLSCFSRKLMKESFEKNKKNAQLDECPNSGCSLQCKNVTIEFSAFMQIQVSL